MVDKNLFFSTNTLSFELVQSAFETWWLGGLNAFWIIFIRNSFVILEKCLSKGMFLGRGQFRAYWYSWLLQNIHFLKSTKMSLSCRTIIYTRQALLKFIPKLSLNSKEHFTYAWCARKKRRKNSTSQNTILVQVSKKLFLTTEIDSWLLQSISS